jgi:1-acyl-sn-glycerol-3-phosphate acyltransferase
MRRGLLYWAGWRLFRYSSRILLRAKVTGAEHVPREGGFILAVNHISYCDPPVVGSWIPRELYFFAKKELFRKPLFGWVLRSVNALPVSRGTIDRAALEMAVDTIRKGFGLTIFPEGTRSRTDEFLPPKPGIGIIASRAACPILVGYVQGTNRLSSCLRWRDKVRIAFGEPFNPDWVASFPSTKEGYQMLAQAVMNRMRELKSQVAAVK